MSKPKFYVFFGSQTGTAEDIAELLARNLSMQMFDVCLAPMNSISYELLSTITYCVFVVSTTGDGVFPDNALLFWKSLLRVDIPSGFLGNMSYSVFGLGDSGYPNFNHAARKLANRLSQLEATMICPRGLGDDRSALGIAGDFDRWYIQLLTALKLVFPNIVVPTTESIPPPQLCHRRYKAYALDEELVPVVLKRERSHPYAVTSTYASIVTENTSTVDYDSAAQFKLEHVFVDEVPVTASLISAQFQTAPEVEEPVVSVNFDLGPRRSDIIERSVNQVDVNENASHNTVRICPNIYRPADIAVVYVPNPASVVDSLCERLGYDSSMVVRLVSFSSTSNGSIGSAFPSSGDHSGRIREELHPLEVAIADRLVTCPPISTIQPRPFPEVFSIHHLLTHVLDVSATPRRGVVQQLSALASDKEQQEKLAEMASPAGADLYHQYFIQEKRSFVELLVDFTSVQIPLQYLIDLLPPLAPRQYSIASAPSFSDSSNVELGLCISQTVKHTKWGRKVIGLASTFLCSLAGDFARIVSGDNMRGYSQNEVFPFSINTTEPIEQSTSLVRIPMFIRRGSIADAFEHHYLAINRNTDAPPLVLIGTGTGFAPLRSVWHSVHPPVANGGATDSSSGSASHSFIQSSVPGLVGCNVIFGCRSELEFLYREEFIAARALEDNLLQQYFGASALNCLATVDMEDRVAFRSQEDTISIAMSRASSDVVERWSNMKWVCPYSPLISVDTSAGANLNSIDIVEKSKFLVGGKTYVQSLIRQQSEYIGALILEWGAVIFIAGRAGRMPEDVKLALRYCIMRYACSIQGRNNFSEFQSEDRASAVIESLQQTQRLVIEAW